MSLQSEDPGTGGVETGPMRATGRVVVIAFAVGLLLAGCNGSGGTGPSQPVVISNLQARTLERPLDDRPFKLEISVTVSEPKRVVGATAALRRLRLPQETCAAPGSGPIVATTPITAANLEGDRLRVVLQPRLPAGRSRLCVLVGLAESLPQKTRGSGIAETPVNQTNELDLVLDVAPAKGGAANGGTKGGAPKAASPPGGSAPDPPPPPPPEPDLPVVTIAATDSSAAESPSFQVSRTGSTSAPLTVSFSVGGTASSSDYSAIGTSVTIPAGAASASITVTPTNDPDSEPSETVELALSANPAAYSLGGASTATVNIASEDVAMSVTINFLAPNGTEYPCGSHVRDNDEKDWSPTVDGSFRLRLGGEREPLRPPAGLDRLSLPEGPQQRDVRDRDVDRQRRDDPRHNLAGEHHQQHAVPGDLPSVRPHRPYGHSPPRPLRPHRGRRGEQRVHDLRGLLHCSSAPPR